MPISVMPTKLDGIVILTPKRFHDDRGCFEETWSRRDLFQAGINIDFVQDNQSYSERCWTMRGLHFQAPPFAQDKLVRCTKGAIFDVAVDVRTGSRTYGQWFGTKLTPENGHQLLIRKGFLHGFLTLKDCTEVQYKCSDYYASSAEGSVHWDSAEINWPLEGLVTIANKDATAIPFSQFDTPFKESICV